MRIIILLMSAKIAGIKRLSGQELVIGRDIEEEDALYLLQNEAAKESFKTEIETAPTNNEIEKPLADYKVPELKALCAKKGIHGVDRLSKNELIAKLESFESEINLDELNEDALRKLAKEEEIDISECPDIEAIRELIADHLGV